MKKPNKRATKKPVKEDSERIATYLSPEVAAWLHKESAKTGLTESAFIRCAIIREMHLNKGV